MVNSFPFILLLGTVLGFLSGIGIGGGSLLILWLTIVLEVPQPIARGINLLFFIPSALVACLFRWKQGIINSKILLPAIFSGCISAAICTWLSAGFDTGLLKKGFGAILIFTALRELFIKKT